VSSTRILLVGLGLLLTFSNVSNLPLGIKRNLIGIRKILWAESPQAKTISWYDTKCMPVDPPLLTPEDYGALGEFRYQIRRFLHFSESAARE
jgi:hypothetical protein